MAEKETPESAEEETAPEKSGTDAAAARRAAEAKGQQDERNKDQVIQDQTREIEELKWRGSERQQGQSIFRIQQASYQKVRGPLGKLLLGGAMVAMPLPAVGLYVGKKIADKTISKVPGVGDVLYNKPMGLVEKAADKTRNAIATAVTAPAAALDATRWAGKGLHWVADHTIFELYRDLKKAINHRFNFAEGTNLLASIMIGIKATLKAITIYPFKLIDAVSTAALKKPLATLATVIAGYAFLSAPAAFIQGAGTLIEKVISILGNLIGKIPAPAAAGAV